MDHRQWKVDASSAFTGQDSIALIVEESSLMIRSLEASLVYATQYHHRKVQSFDKTVSRKTTIRYRTSMTILGHRRRPVTSLTFRLPRTQPAYHCRHTRERYSLALYKHDVTAGYIEVVQAGSEYYDTSLTSNQTFEATKLHVCMKESTNLSR